MRRPTHPHPPLVPSLVGRCVPFGPGGERAQGARSPDPDARSPPRRPPARRDAKAADFRNQVARLLLEAAGVPILNVWAATARLGATQARAQPPVAAARCRPPLFPLEVLLLGSVFVSLLTLLRDALPPPRPLAAAPVGARARVPRGVVPGAQEDADPGLHPLLHEDGVRGGGNERAFGARNREHRGRAAVCGRGFGERGGRELGGGCWRSRVTVTR